jgi:hypothetical protein
MTPLPEKSQPAYGSLTPRLGRFYANERMAEILGTCVSGMMGRSSLGYVFPEDIPAAQRLFDFKKRGDSGRSAGVE